MRQKVGKRSTVFVSLLLILALLFVSAMTVAFIGVYRAGSPNNSKDNAQIDDSVLGGTAAATDTFTAGLPDKSKYFYTDIDKGLAISGTTGKKVDFS